MGQKIPDIYDIRKTADATNEDSIHNIKQKQVPMSTIAFGTINNNLD